MPGSGEWWHTSNGTNMLAGIVGSTTNPANLPDEYISEFLNAIQEARNSFERLVPQMLVEEQERLTLIASGSCHFTGLDPRDVEDNFQHRMNTQVIRTSGPRGGGNWYPPPM